MYIWVLAPNLHNWSVFCRRSNAWIKNALLCMRCKNYFLYTSPPFIRSYSHHISTQISFFLMMRNFSIPIFLRHLYLYINLACLSVCLFVCLGVCLFVSNKRQNGWTDRAQIFCGTSRDPREGLWMIKIKKKF